jgi:hypothetical protein
LWISTQPTVASPMITATANRPGRDADVADGLPFGFVLRDLAIARFVILIRVARPPPPARVN